MSLVDVMIRCFYVDTVVPKPGKTKRVGQNERVQTYSSVIFQMGKTIRAIGLTGISKAFMRLITKSYNYFHFSTFTSLANTPSLRLAQIFFLSFVLHFVWLGFAEPSMAGSPMPGENQPTFLYKVTHLHPAVYVLLFLIFVISIINLFLQGWISLDRSFSYLIGKLIGSEGLTNKRIKGIKRGNAFSSDTPEDAVVGVKRSASGNSRIPTPLDGVNHPMPYFGGGAGMQTGAPRILKSRPSEKNGPTEFKFSAAVDIPSAEELERRGKEQVVVSGIVVGNDGKGLSSVIVYLTDEEGNRLGQSCRSAPETGEFKVLAKEPGRYFLNGYKRGFIMDLTEPLILPEESRQIEGLNFRMIPEGCLVYGRVINEDETPIPNVSVRCLGVGTSALRIGTTDEFGAFRITGISTNTKCRLEVLDAAGNPIVVSNDFETVQKREIYKELIVSIHHVVEPGLDDASDEFTSSAASG